MGGKGKGGARAAYLPPARSRAPNPEDAGPSITDKIKARKEHGEGWDEFKKRIAAKQAESHALENHDIALSQQHREMLDREHDVRGDADEYKDERYIDDAFFFLDHK